MTDDARMERLPKWARDEIKVLNMRLAEARERLSQGPENSDTIAEPFGDAPRPLGTGTIVRFTINPSDPDDWASYFDVSLREGELRVRSGSARTAVLPESSNGFRVRLVS
jgi:hypothetical protein